jgi:uncharacterized membrane protein
MSFATTLSDAFMVVFQRSTPATAEEIAAKAEEDRDDAAAAGPIAIRKVGLDALMPALAQGFDDLHELRTDQITMAVIFPLCGLVVAGVVADRALLPFLFPAASGFALIGPLATLWYAALSRGRELYGEDAAGRHPLHIFFGPRGRSLRILGGVAILLFLLWNGAAGLIYHLTLGTSPEKPDAFFLVRVLTTAAGWEMIVIGCGVGAIFALIAVAIGCVSFPLALDRSVTASEAIRVSLDAVTRNPIFMLCWGLVIVTGLLIGAIPGLLGLAITLPVLGHSTWHIYRRIVA